MGAARECSPSRSSSADRLGESVLNRPPGVGGEGRGLRTRAGPAATLGGCLRQRAQAQGTGDVHYEGGLAPREETAAATG